MAFGQYTVSECPSQDLLSSFPTRTATSKIGGQVVHLSLMMCTCASWLRAIPNRKQVSRGSFGAVMVNRDWSFDGSWPCVRAFEMSTPPADRLSVSSVWRQSFPCWCSGVPKHASTPLSLELKSGFCTPMLIANSRVAYSLNTQKGQPSLVSIQNQSFCQYVETASDCCILTFCHRTPASLSCCAANKNVIWPLKCNSSARVTAPYAFTTTKPDPTLQTSSSKSCLSRAEKALPTPYSLHLAPFNYHELLSLSSAQPYKTFFNKDDLNQWL